MITDAKYVAERDRRVALLDKLMVDTRVDALVLTSTAQQAYQIATKYVSGYQLTTRRDFVFMKPGEMPRLIIPTVGQQFHARRLSWLPDENIYCGPMVETVCGWIRELGLTKPRVGMYATAELPVPIQQAILDAGAEIVDITDAYTKARQPKSEFEVELTREATRIAVESFEHVVKMIEVGATERQMVGAGEGYLRAHGAEDSLVLVRSQHPHSFICRPTDYRMERDTATIYSAEVAGPFGYWTQVLRPIFFSKGCQPEVRHILEVIKEAEAAGAEAMKIGNTVADVAKAVEKVVAQNGCKTGVWSGHGMGHDLGDGVDIGNMNEMEIVPNMVLTLHPSVLSDKDGFLFGNTWLATPDGAELLSPQYYNTHELEELKELVHYK